MPQFSSKVEEADVHSNEIFSTFGSAIIAYLMVPDGSRWFHHGAAIDKYIKVSLRV